MHTDYIRDAALPFVPAKAKVRGPWLRILSEVLGLAGPDAELLRHTEREWASATFSGARHAIALAFEGSDAVLQGETFIAALPDHEFTVPRHLVADAAIVATHQRQDPPCLTVEIELLVLLDL